MSDKGWGGGVSGGGCGGGGGCRVGDKVEVDFVGR